MKKLTTFALLLFTAFTIVAQTGGLMEQYDIISGKNYKNNGSILAKEYAFEDKIDQFYLDTTTNTVTLQLLEKNKTWNFMNMPGRIVLFDLKTNSIRWDKKLMYPQDKFEQFGDVIFEKTMYKSNYLNIENGTTNSELKNTIYHCDPIRKIGIGYKINFGGEVTNNLQAIDLRTNNVLWKRQITHQFGWNSVSNLNDSVLLLVSDGLHIFNVNTGFGWDYECTTGRNDYTATILTNVFGIALGVLTGTFVTSTGHDQVTDLTSNALIDSTNIYIASRDKLSCLSFDGSLKWSSPLDKKMMSKSSIFMKDSLVYIVNKGYAFMNNAQIDYGKPLLTAFNKNTGKQAFISLILKNNYQIKDFQVFKDSVLIYSKDNISTYSLNGGAQISDKYINTETTGELDGFVGNQVFIKVDSTYKSLVSIDNTKHYLTTLKNKVLVANNQLEITQQIDFEKLYICYLTTKNYRFLAKGDDTIVIDKNNKIVADFKSSSKAILVGTKLIDILEKSIIVIDLSELMNK